MSPALGGREEAGSARETEKGRVRQEENRTSCLEGNETKGVKRGMSDETLQTGQVRSGLEIDRSL